MAKLPESQKENALLQASNVSTSPRMLGDITNCTIGNLTINMNPSITIHRSAQEIEAEFESLVV